MSSFDKAESIATNTLLCPNIPSEFFVCDQALLTLHDACAKFGPIYTFVPMKTFRRIMIIFQETLHALQAKTELDRLTLHWEDSLENIGFDQTGSENWTLRLYYGQHFNIHQNASTLEVPRFKRNLLISPPGSPCAGWEQIEEDSPNRAVLASDLFHAQQDISDYELDDDELELPTVQPLKKTSVVCVQGTQSPHLPSITVEDCDGHDIKRTTLIPPTPMPPRRYA